MTKQSINIGTTANDKTGDSLRAAFNKVNQNFTELYTVLGLDTDGLNLGAFEFNGSVMSTTDSTAIVIDQATTISSNLTVGGDIVPQTANGGDLGSAAKPWRSLYVSNNTIYIGGTAVGVDANGNLTTNGTTLTSDRLVNGANTVSLGSTGELRLPNDATIRTTAGDAVAFGFFAGETLQGDSATAIGNSAGQTTQGTSAVAIGPSAGNDTQGTNAVAIGSGAGNDTQGMFAVAIGSGAGEISQGENAVAIGGVAGQNSQAANSIVINATGALLQNTTAGSLVVAPIRNVSGTSGVLQYNETTKEVSYSSDIRSEGNINIDINLSDSTLRRWQFGEDGALTLPAGGSILDSSGQPYVNGITSISSSVSTGIFTDASGDYQYGTLSYDYAVNGVTSGGFSIEYSRPLVGGNVDINVGNTIVNGDLTLSGDIKSDSNINIDINLADSTLRRWQFGEDGVLTTPGAIQVTSGTSTIQLIDNQIGIVATVSQSPHLILKGSDTYGGDVYLYGGTKSGSSLWGGNIILSPETNDGGTYGETFIKKSWRANSDAWKFSRDGVFSLPPGGTLRFPDSTVQTTAWAGIPGPYADDSAAATAGVAVGYPYHKTGTGGQVFVRLS